MLYVKWITVGDLPRGPFQLIAGDIKTSLQAFVKLEHRTVSELTLAHMKSNRGPVILLDAEGQQLDSIAFSGLCRKWEDAGEHVTFCLGGAKGLSSEIKSAATLCLSLSKMTTTHDLAHLFFLEQLYRSMTILRGKTYHY